MASSWPLLWIIAIELFIFTLASLSALGYVASFVLGFGLAVVLVLCLVFFGLDTVELHLHKKTRALVNNAARDLRSNGIVEIADVSQLQSEVLLFVRPQNKDRVSHWYKAYLKNNTILFQEAKPLKPDEVKKGVILMDDVVVTIVKTKKGSLWKKANYLEIAHPTRFLLGDARALYLAFRTRREMEEWFYALEKASKFHQRVAHPGTDNVFKSLGKKYLPGMNAPQVDAPWFNALAQRMFRAYTQDNQLRETIQKKINKQFNKIPNKPDIVKSLQVVEVTWGEALPSFDNFQLLQVTSAGSVKLISDMTYGGGFELKLDIILETPKLLDWIEARVLPVSLCARVKSMAGKLVLHMAAPPADRLWFGFEGEPQLDLDVETEMDLGLEEEAFGIANQFPKLGSVMLSFLRHEILDFMLLPEMGDVPLLGLSSDESEQLRQRWESEEARQKADDEIRNNKAKKREAKKAAESASQIQHRHHVKDNDQVKAAVLKHFSNQYFGHQGEKESKQESVEPTKAAKSPAPKPAHAPSDAKSDFELFDEAVHSIDEALTNFLGNLAPTPEKRKVDEASKGSTSLDKSLSRSSSSNRGDENRDVKASNPFAIDISTGTTPLTTPEKPPPSQIGTKLTVTEISRGELLKSTSIHASPPPLPPRPSQLSSPPSVSPAFVAIPTHLPSPLPKPKPSPHLVESAPSTSELPPSSSIPSASQPDLPPPLPPRVATSSPNPSLPSDHKKSPNPSLPSDHKKADIPVQPLVENRIDLKQPHKEKSEAKLEVVANPVSGKESLQREKDVVAKDEKKEKIERKPKKLASSFDDDFGYISGSSDEEEESEPSLPKSSSQSQPPPASAYQSHIRSPSFPTIPTSPPSLPPRQHQGALSQSTPLNPSSNSNPSTPKASPAAPAFSSTSPKKSLEQPSSNPFHISSIGPPPPIPARPSAPQLHITTPQISSFYSSHGSSSFGSGISGVSAASLSHGPSNKWNSSTGDKHALQGAAPSKPPSTNPFSYTPNPNH